MTLFTKQYAQVGTWTGTDPVTGEKTEHPSYDYNQPLDNRADFVGTTLCDREENYYDDSDGYAHVFNPETGRIERHGTWTTRFGHSSAGVTVDAYDTAGVHYAAMVEAHIKAIAAVMAVHNKGENRNRLIVAFTPEKGDYVRVVKGRKVPIGTEGTVIWTGERRYGQTYSEWAHHDVLRVGIKDANGDVHWTSATNVVLVDEQDYDLLPETQEACEAVVRAMPTAGDLKALHRAYCASTSRLAYIR